MLFSFSTNKEKGRTLPSVFLALVGSVGLILALSGVLNNREIEGNLLGLKLFQKLTHEKVLSSAANPINLYKSVGTASFMRCLKNDGATNCTSTNWIQFDARQYYNGNQSDPALISGNGSFYNIRGVLCERDNTQTCPFTSTTWYKINCHDGSASCNVAESISVSAEIGFDTSRFKDNRLNSSGKFKFKKYPAVAADVPYAVFPSDIAQAIYQECPSGANATGLDSSGIMVCDCAPGFKEVQVAGVKLTCESIYTRGSILGNTDTINKTVYANGVDIECKATPYHKLVSISGLGECGVQGDKNRVGSKVVCSKKGIDYKCVKFADEHQWAKD